MCESLGIHSNKIRVENMAIGRSVWKKQIVSLSIISVVFLMKCALAYMHNPCAHAWCLSEAASADKERKCRM